MHEKRRVTATVDSEALEAAHAAVARGEASSVSDWVNTALHRQADHDARMQALTTVLTEYEAQHGAITDAEMEAATRATKARALVVRGRDRGAA